MLAPPDLVSVCVCALVHTWCFPCGWEGAELQKQRWAVSQRAGAAPTLARSGWFLSSFSQNAQIYTLGALSAHVSIDIKVGAGAGG